VTGVPRTRRRRAGRHGRPLHSRPNGMRHEKTILPLTTQQNYRGSHRVSLLSFPPTQEATRRPSPTSGPRMMQAPHVRDRGCVSPEGGYNFGVKQSLNGRPRSAETSDRTAGRTHGLRARGSWRQYFEGFYACALPSHAHRKRDDEANKRGKWLAPENWKHMIENSRRHSSPLYL
jgi:hypothetical protein